MIIAFVMGCPSYSTGK